MTAERRATHTADPPCPVPLQSGDSVQHCIDQVALVSLTPTPEHSLNAFKYFLPKWTWDQNPDSFDWSSEFPLDLQPSSWASISQDNWRIAVNFFKTLKWKIDDSLCVSYIELAYHFFFSQEAFSGIENSPSNIASILRKVINQAIKLDSHFPLVIGTQKPGCLSRGKALPAGYLQGN